MTDLLVTLTFAPTNGMAHDEVVNTFAMRTTDAFASSTDPDAIAAGLGVLYNVAPPESGNTLASFMSEELSRVTNAHTVRIYNITGKLKNAAYTQANGKPGQKPPAHGSPIATVPFTLGAESGSNLPLPRQVAAVLTTRALDWQTVPVEAADDAPITRTGGGDTPSDPYTATDRPKQRLSGRHFFGPFHAGALAGATTSSEIPLNPRTTILNAAGDMYSALLGQGIEWCVWSRQLGALNPITHLQIDDSWDIQRRRKKDATARTTLQVLA